MRRAGQPQHLPCEPFPKTYMISTALFLDTYHVSDTVLEAGDNTIAKPTGGLRPFGSHTLGVGKDVNSSIVTMTHKALPNLCPLALCLPLTPHSFSLTPLWPPRPPGWSWNWVAMLLPQGLCTAIPSTWNTSPPIHGSLLRTPRPFLRAPCKPFLPRPPCSRSRTHTAPRLALPLPSFNFPSSTYHLLRRCIVHSFISFLSHLPLLSYVLHRAEVLSSALPGTGIDPGKQTGALTRCSVNICGINKVNK